MIRPLHAFSLTLEEAANLLNAERKNFENVEFSGLTHSDSEIKPGDIFLAFPGSKVHGGEFISAAISKGAVAVLTDKAGANFSTVLPTLIVSDAREAGALLAAHFYHDPIRAMKSIGITGTNGKTTVTTLLYQLFSALGRESGLIGTVETRIGSESIKSERTTPEAADLQALAATMREQEMRHLVMEVSSHSLDLQRLAGSFFSIVGFTNLTQDHLDYHQDMESYFKVKSKLFTREYSDTGFINIDDTYGARLYEEAPIKVFSLSRHNPKATWHYVEINPLQHGFEFEICGRDGVSIKTRTSLQGGFNLDNLLLAIAIAYECEVTPEEISAIVPTLTGAPGRLEAVVLGQNFKALVDYAHSPDAVVNVLQAVREFTPGRVIAVLGCGGDRDATKRPLMGSALINGSDIAVFTSDNPRNEDAIEILQQMVSGNSVTTPSQVISDRAEAIAYAVSVATAGDTVIILGKGHESGQDISGFVTDFDDRIHLAQEIEARR